MTLISGITYSFNLPNSTNFKNLLYPDRSELALCYSQNRQKLQNFEVDLYNQSERRHEIVHTDDNENNT